MYLMLIHLHVQYNEYTPFVVLDELGFPPYFIMTYCIFSSSRGRNLCYNSGSWEHCSD